MQLNEIRNSMRNLHDIIESTETNLAEKRAAYAQAEQVEQELAQFLGNS